MPPRVICRRHRFPSDLKSAQDAERTASGRIGLGQELPGEGQRLARSSKRCGYAHVEPCHPSRAPNNSTIPTSPKIGNNTR